MKVAFCTTCRNRTDHLKQTLPRNIADNREAIHVVLDYGSTDDLLEWLHSAMGWAIADGRLIVYSHSGPEKFRMAHAKNMAHRCGLAEGADVLVNMDADNYAGSGFDDFLIREFRVIPKVFFRAHMIKGKMTRGISGRIALSAQAFLKSGGYDEAKFDGWGSDDKDLHLRLRALDYDNLQIPPSYIRSIQHSDKMRFRDYPELADQTDDYFEINWETITNVVANDGAVGCGTVFRNFLAEPIQFDPVPTRVFGIGMHKTATVSLHEAFKILGYDSWHWSSAHSAKAIWREMNTTGRSRTAERYYALCDLPIPLLFWQLDAAYPGSKFILTVRDDQKWLDTVDKHYDPSFNVWRQAWDTDPFTNRIHQVLYGRTDFDAEMMLARYRSHNSAVLDYFRYRPRDLLVMDMDRGAGWPELCRFLDRPMPVQQYPHANGDIRKADMTVLHNYAKRPRAVHQSWNVPELCAAYGLPTGLPGGGKIAIVELGGGWIQSDIAAFFTKYSLPQPTITDISVDDAVNNGDPTDPASGEVALDGQIAAAVYSHLTGQAANVGYFWAQNSNINGIADAIKMAASMGYDVMSCSWGADEADWGRVALSYLDAAAVGAYEVGMTVFAASGDNDSSDGGRGSANVDSPASCQHVLGCGGTNKPHRGAETVWNNNPGNANGEGTGGGYSTFWRMPPWQLHGGAPKMKQRMVPDVAGVADPNTGFNIYLDGRWEVFGGTSCVAPFWAGLVAACGSKKGFLNPILWNMQNRGCFVTNISGNNGPGAVHAQPPCPGPCTGLGIPAGAALTKLLT